MSNHENPKWNLIAEWFHMYSQNRRVNKNVSIFIAKLCWLLHCCEYCESTIEHNRRQQRLLSDGRNKNQLCYPCDEQHVQRYVHLSIKNVASAKIKDKKVKPTKPSHPSNVFTETNKTRRQYHLFNNLPTKSQTNTINSSEYQSEQSIQTNGINPKESIFLHHQKVNWNHTVVKLLNQ